jgi:hypothetical protein
VNAVASPGLPAFNPLDYTLVRLACLVTLPEMIPELEVFAGLLAAGIQIEVVRLPLGRRHEKIHNKGCW